MRVETLADAISVARAGAAFTAAEARAAVAARGRFIVAISGGRTPWTMLRALADEQMPWAGVQVVQVDERVAPDGDPDRNLTHLRESLLAHCPLRPEQVHAMPVESADLEAASGQYAMTLRQIAGSPAVLDLAHLGLGPDGHTASLVPGDPVLDVTDADVALTEVYHLAELVVLRIASDCAHPAKRGAIGIRPEPAAAIVRRHGGQTRRAPGRGWIHPPGLAQWANRARAMATRINPSRPSIRPHSQSFWQTHLFCGLLLQMFVAINGASASDRCRLSRTRHLARRSGPSKRPRPKR